MRAERALSCRGLSFDVLQDGRLMADMARQKVEQIGPPPRIVGDALNDFRSGLTAAARDLGPA